MQKDKHAAAGSKAAELSALSEIVGKYNMPVEDLEGERRLTNLLQALGCDTVGKIEWCSQWFCGAALIKWKHEAY